MRRSVRATAVLATVALLAVAAAPATLAAGPERFVIDLDDPQVDVDETAWISELCGFPVEAEVAGHVIVLAFPESEHPTFAINVYGTRVSYHNPANDKVIRLRDVGPDRFFIKDGKAYAAVTGRSPTGSGVIGLVVLDLETGEAVFTAGNEVGFFYDGFCEAIG